MAKITKEAYEVAGKFWHRELRPLHFSNEASQRYGYAKRDGERGSGKPFRGSYTERKLRKYGHTRPLELTGESRRQTRIARIVATKNSVKVRMTARKLNFVPTAREELTKIIPQEADRIVREIDRTVDRLLNEKE